MHFHICTWGGAPETPCVCTGYWRVSTHSFSYANIVFQNYDLNLLTTFKNAVTDSLAIFYPVELFCNR